MQQTFPHAFVSLLPVSRTSLPGSANALQTTVLVAVLAVVSEFPAGLTRCRLAHTRVHGLRRRSRQSIRRRGLNRFLPMAALDIGVVGLTARVVNRVGGESLASGSGAGRVGFSVEFLRVVCGGGLDTGLVLLSMLVYLEHILQLYYGVGVHTPPCSWGPPEGCTPGLNSPCLLVAMELTLSKWLILIVSIGVR